jgi:hypothetical protein
MCGAVCLKFYNPGSPHDGVKSEKQGAPQNEKFCGALIFIVEGRARSAHICAMT